MSMEKSVRILCLFVVLVPLLLYEAWVITRQDPQRVKSVRMQITFVLMAITFLGSRFIWRRFSVLTHSNSVSTGAVLKFLLLVFLIMGPLSFACLAMTATTDPSLLSYVVTLCLGAGFFLSFSMIVIDISVFLCRRMLCRSRVEAGRTEIKIRMLMSLVSALLLVVVGVLEANRLTVEHVTVPVKGLHPLLNGTTIVQISDVHLGPFNGRSRMGYVVDRIRSVKGDMIVITGDLVDASVEALREAVTPLKKLEAKYGVFYVTGNHEYYTGDVDNWLLEMPKLNITPLVNQRVCVPMQKKQPDCQEGFYLAGLEDLATRTMRYGSHSMDIHSALTGRTVGVPTVVLAHQPWAAREAIMWDDVRLVLSGHTHAGQILPLMFTTYMYNPFFVGLYQPFPQVYVYVSPGTVYYFLPFRHYRPEITCITLVSQ